MPPNKKYSRQELLSMNKGSSSGKLLIDLGCGERKRDGYVGVDTANLKGVDIVCDIAQGRDRCLCMQLPVALPIQADAKC